MGLISQSDLEDEVENEEGEEEAGEVAEGQQDDEPLSHDDHGHHSETDGWPLEEKSRV